MGFGDTRKQARAEILLDFPSLQLQAEDPFMGWFTSPIVDFLAGKAPFPTFPLDVAGTPFQRLVWDGLCAIRTGATCSYGELARRIGRADAPRAVGAAVGANPVSILIPCHRALAADGSLHNYRYGIERKRRLLELEGASFRAPSVQRCLPLSELGENG